MMELNMAMVEERKNNEKLKLLQAQVKIGGKGTVRRKKKVVHRTATKDDKKLQSSIQKLSVNKARMEERRYKVFEECETFNTDRDIDKECTESVEFDMFNTDRDSAKGHITFSETKWQAELEKLAVEEFIAKYVHYSTMASEANIIKDRDINGVMNLKSYIYWKDFV